MKRFPSRSSVVLAALFTLPMGAQTHKAPAKPTDWQIEAKVQAALNDNAFKGSSIVSSVKGGIVTLTGNVRSEAEKELASQDLASINGVKTVLNNLNIVTATPAAAAPAPVVNTAPTPKTVTLAEGTMVPVRLAEEIDTKTAKAGDTFHAATASNLTLLNYNVVPTGTTVTGRVVDAKPAGRLSGAAELIIELVSIRLNTPNGPQDVSVVTTPLSSKANGRGTNTAAKTGGGVAFGAIVGALAGGGTGAGVGALSGGALGLGANALTHGKDIDLKPETLENFRTTAPLNVTIMVQNGQQVPQAPAPSPALQSRPVQQ